MRHLSIFAARSFVLVAAVGVVLAGCTSSGSGDDSGTALSAKDVTGEWSQPKSEPLVYLELIEAGTVSGSDGCNQLNGTWKIDGSTIEFGPFAATMMACDGVDTWLSGASSATVSGDVLTVLDDGGKKIGTLEKTD
ncbi:META domain-containing protein [Cellulomonas sp. P5_E12]